MKKIKRKRFVYIAIVMIFFVCLGSFSTRAEEKKIGLADYEVKVECGLDGCVKMNKPMPVKISVKSKKTDFKGKLEISFQEMENERLNSYFVNLDLSKGKSHEIQFNINNIKKYYAIKIVDKNGKTVYQNTGVISKMIDLNSIAVGVLSDKPANLKYFDNIELLKMQYINTRIMRLDAKKIPDNVTALGVLDYIIIDDFDTNQLSKKQYEALIQWIKNGGNVIIGLGSNVEKTYQAFQNDYPITVIKAENSALSIKKTNSNVKTFMITLKEDGIQKDTSILSEGNLYNQKIGQGNLCLTGFSMMDKEVLKWNRKKQFARKLLLSFANVIDRYSNTAYSSDSYYNLIEPLSIGSETKPANITKYLFIMIIYILLMAPVSYFYLKKKGKAEWMLLCVIICSVMFTLFIAIGSNATRIKKNISTSITVFNDIQNDDAYVYSSIFSQNNNDLSLKFQPQLQNIFLYGGDSSYDVSMQQKVKIGVDTNHASYEKRDPGCFTSSYYIGQLQNSAQNKQFECDIQADIDGISGTITNISEYDLEDIIVFYLGSYIRIEELNKGQTYTITSKDRLHTFDNDFGYFFERTGKCNKHGIEKRCLNSNEKLLRFIYTQYIESMANSYVNIFGIAQNYHKDYIKNSSVKEKNSAIMLTQLRDVNGSSELYLMNLAGNNVIDSSDSWIIGKDGMAYEFNEVYDTISYYNALHPTKLFLSESVDEKKLSIMLYNYETGKYDNVFAGGKVSIEEDELAQYTSDGELKVRYTSLIGEQPQKGGKGIKIPRMDMLAHEQD